jgi:hypothetical protein
MPAAIFGTRIGRSLRLIDAGYAIPLGILLGVAAVAAARAARHANERSLGRLGGTKAARFGRIVGTAGVCIALTALISLGVYAFLRSRN